MPLPVTAGMVAMVVRAAGVARAVEVGVAAATGGIAAVIITAATHTQHAMVHLCMAAITPTDQ